jgi:hypothetical protein
MLSVFRAESRTRIIAGNNNEIITATIPTTTTNSIKVNPRRLLAFERESTTVIPLSFEEKPRKNSILPIFQASVASCRAP